MTELDADHYRKHSSFQYELACEILGTLKLKGDETILDVGCGEGRITAELSLRVPHGKVIGMDSSASMIRLAKKSFHTQDYPNLSFKHSSAEEMHCAYPADIILILNTLHWIRNPKMALLNISNCLKSEGSLFILTYPKESPYWQFLEDTIQNEEWISFASKSAFHIACTTQKYRQLLEECGFDINECALEEKVASYLSPAALGAYIKGWLQCYVPLPQKLTEKFLEQATKRAQNCSVSNGSGEIRLPYLKLTLKAQKKKALFAVLYQGYVKQGHESEYQNAWHTVAAYFVEKRGALGSSLHRTEEGLWVAYSRWPNRATRDASWPKESAPSPELPQDIRQAIMTLKACIERPLPEICMEVVDHVQRQIIEAPH